MVFTGLVVASLAGRASSLALAFWGALVFSKVWAVGTTWELNEAGWRAARAALEMVPTAKAAASFAEASKVVAA